MGPFDRYRARLDSAGLQYGFDDSSDVVSAQSAERADFTAEQLMELAWRVAGATMAAIGVPRLELPAYGQMLEPTIHDLVREWGMSPPHS